jgi:hypothetical protein
MAPPQQVDTVIQKDIQEKVDIKKLAHDGYYLQFPEKTAS